MKFFSTAIAVTPGNNDAGSPKKMPVAAGWYGIILAAILGGALVLRLYGYAGGLPSVNDPDEPLFVLIAGKMLAGHGLNPGWFGHPGTMTFYSLAIVFLGIMIGGVINGTFANAQAFIAFAYSDPSMLFAAGRLLMVAFGTICVILTALVARRLFGGRVALIAAALLAISPLHITYSQIIRTDMQVSIFMLLAVLASIGIARGGRLSAYIAAGIFIGMACATKWPAATFIICPVCATVFRASRYPAQARLHLRNLAITLATSLVSLLAISPYLVLDYRTVLSNLGGEFQPHHLGATGGGFFHNLLWYFTHPIRESFGLAGLGLCLLGLPALMRHRLATLLILPSTVAFLIFIAVQTLVWDRWVVPLLPFFSLCAALGISRLWDLSRAKGGVTAILALIVALACGVAAPLLLTARANATERLNDTRNLAAAWVAQNVPAGRSIVIEHFGFDLALGPWQLLVPAGGAGCVTADKAIGGQIQYDTIHKWRGNRAIVDFGTVDESSLASCRADFAIFSHYDRYAAERAVYPRETAQYEKAIDAGILLKTIRPSPGLIGGPVIRIVMLNK